jgi:hypothetical protein
MLFPVNYNNGERFATGWADFNGDRHADSSATLRISNLWCGAALMGLGTGSRYRNGSAANL